VKAIHYLNGGGLGDIFRESCYHNALGILKRWKLEHPGSTLKVFLMSHNPASQELLAYEGWIDEVVQRPFPLALTWRWEDAYTLYAAEFEGHTELRFNLSEGRSLYASSHNKWRPKKPAWSIEYIDPIGVAWEPAITISEQDEVEGIFLGQLVYHPFAGQASRTLPGAIEDLVAEHAPLVLGANYGRDEHGTECGITFNPRILYHGLRAARAVVGAESSVWYLGTMLGRPAALLYQPEQTYDLVQRGLSNWNWYFFTHPESRAFRLPLEEPAWLREWLDRVMA
jgi:hypothetical protein